MQGRCWVSLRTLTTCHLLTTIYTNREFAPPENTDGDTASNWLDFDAGWTDGGWHHVAVTWAFDDGTTKLYLDGEPKTPFWRSRWGGGGKPISRGSRPFARPT
jgi:hypothetical protein